MSRIKRDTEKKGLSRIGKIKVGMKNKDGIPMSLDYFRADAQPIYTDAFHEAYGDKPTRLEIVFISDNTDDSCIERWELRKQGRLWGYSNNSDYYLYDKTIDGFKLLQPENEEDFRNMTAEKIQSKWKVSLTLNFILPKLKGFIGFWSFTTHGESSSIPEIVSTFDFVLEQFGRVKMVPFDLTVEKITSQKPDSKNVYPVVKLIPNISAQNVETIKQLMEGDVNGIKAIEAPVETDIID